MQGGGGGGGGAIKREERGGGCEVLPLQRKGVAGKVLATLNGGGGGSFEGVLTRML